MIKLFNIDHFKPEDTFFCGQCFRWRRDEDGVFRGVVKNHAVKMYYTPEGAIYLESTNPDLIYWSRYLSFSTDYNAVEEELSKDAALLPCIEASRGVRLLHQDLWETLVSFIISANNNIPRISGIIERLCECFGEKIEFDGETYHGFPTPERLASLSLEDFAPLRAGFRDKYISDAAKKVASGEIDLEKIKLLSDEDAKRELMKISGVGEKIADCVLLFALSRYKTFPKDVWIKRIMKEEYGVCENDIDKFVCERFGNYAGIAQQYLYYYHAIKKS